MVEKPSEGFGSEKTPNRFKGRGLLTLHFKGMGQEHEKSEPHTKKPFFTPMIKMNPTR